METTTIEKMHEASGGEITPKHYYRWGNEPTGHVSTGLYIDDVWYSTGMITKQEAEKYHLTYHCPYP